MDWPATHQSLLGGLSAGLGWERFYAQYSGVIRNFVRGRGLDEHSADDVVQETVMVLVRELPKFKYDPERGKFRAWLKTVVLHKTEEARRRRREDKNISGDAPQEDGTTFFERLAAEEQTNLADKDEADWRRAIYAEAWQRVCANTKPATVEVFVALMRDPPTPVEQIAQQSGLDRNAIDQAKHRVKSMLKKEVQRLESITLGPANSPAARTP